MSWGGAPRCTQCGQAVYHAEQAMGPARKVTCVELVLCSTADQQVYHKLCLKCLNCGKRVDPGSLVEHDSEVRHLPSVMTALTIQPYCSRCHSQLFGTKGTYHGKGVSLTIRLEISKRSALVCYFDTHTYTRSSTSTSISSYTALTSPTSTSDD